MSPPATPKMIRIIQSFRLRGVFDPVHARNTAPIPAHGVPAMKNHAYPHPGSRGIVLAPPLMTSKKPVTHLGQTIHPCMPSNPMPTIMAKRHHPRLYRRDLTVEVSRLRRYQADAHSRPANIHPGTAPKPDSPRIAQENAPREAKSVTGMTKSLTSELLGIAGCGLSILMLS